DAADTARRVKHGTGVPWPWPPPSSRVWPVLALEWACGCCWSTRRPPSRPQVGHRSWTFQPLRHQPEATCNGTFSEASGWWFSRGKLLPRLLVADRLRRAGRSYALGKRMRRLPKSARLHPRTLHGEWLPARSERRSEMCRCRIVNLRSEEHTSELQSRE